MGDLTVRLRRGFGGMVPPVCDEAANEIERLTTENGELDACATDYRHEIERLNIEHGDMNLANVEYEKEIERLTTENSRLVNHNADLANLAERLTAEVKNIEDATMPFFTWIYNQGYQQGHHDTVEGMFTDVHPDDSSEYHDDIVAELLGDYARSTASASLTRCIFCRDIDEPMPEWNGKCPRCSQQIWSAADQRRCTCGPGEWEIKQGCPVHDPFSNHGPALQQHKESK